MPTELRPLIKEVRVQEDHQVELQFAVNPSQQEAAEVVRLVEHAKTAFWRQVHARSESNQLRPTLET